MRKIIRLGDSTSHGGKVVSASSHMTVGGIPVARLGDKCTCPKRGHNNCVIVEGDTNWTIDDIPVALEGHKISCGAVLISSSPNNGREDSGGAAASFAQATNSAIANNAASTSTSTNNSEVFDEQVHLNTIDQPALAGLPFYVENSDGRQYSGRADAQGLLPRISTEGAEQYTVYWGDEALAKMHGDQA
jgi:uncharacterized Zn-binding protein involved in type VI secretion